MNYRARRSEVYDRTGGYCHGCGKKLAYRNYGAIGERGAWEIDHSRARANGGTHRINNLYSACVYCNRSKRDGSTRTLRARNGMTRAPASREARQARARRMRALKIGVGVGVVAVLAVIVVRHLRTGEA